MKYKLAHACIRVMDLEKSIKFYKEALGLVERRRDDYPQWSFTLVYLSDENNNFEIELTYNYNPEKPYNLGNGFSHFAVYVSDLQESYSNHKKAGYDIKDIKSMKEGLSFYFITDPDGYSIEIIEKK